MFQGFSITTDLNHKVETKTPGKLSKSHIFQHTSLAYKNALYHVLNFPIPEERYSIIFLLP